MLSFLILFSTFHLDTLRSSHVVTYFQKSFPNYLFSQGKAASNPFHFRVAGREFSIFCEFIRWFPNMKDDLVSIVEQIAMLPVATSHPFTTELAIIKKKYHLWLMHKLHNFVRIITVFIRLTDRLTEFTAIVYFFKFFDW